MKVKSLYFQILEDLENELGREPTNAEVEQRYAEVAAEIQEKERDKKLQGM